MMNQKASRNVKPAIFLTIFFSVIGLHTADAASGVGRSATVKTARKAPPPAPAAQTQAAPAQQAAAPQVAPPANVDTLKLSTSDNDEAGTLPERIDVQSMKKRYWTVGNEDLMDVVQNRLYTKKGRMEAALRYGFWSDDPFIDHKTIGLSLGFHLNEFISVHGFYASISSATNAAYAQASEATGNVIFPDTNPGKSVMGAEARASLIYGKLSLLGNSIVYYDLNVAAGFSQHTATVGSSVGYFAGLGQQFYLNRTVFITVDYRMLFHSDKFPSTTQPLLDRSRSLTTNWIQVGVGVFAF